MNDACVLLGFGLGMIVTATIDWFAYGRPRPTIRTETALVDVRTREYVVTAHGPMPYGTMRWACDGWESMPGALILHNAYTYPNGNPNDAATVIGFPWTSVTSFGVETWVPRRG